MNKRKIVRTPANQAIRENRPLDWFEELYEKSATENAKIPWSDLVPNPNAVELLEELRDIDLFLSRG